MFSVIPSIAVAVMVGRYGAGALVDSYIVKPHQFYIGTKEVEDNLVA